MRKLVAVFLMLTMLLSCVSAYAEDSVLSNYLDPDNEAKPMVRMWFPDASAGADEDDTIEKQILSLAEAGIGGVEITMLADNTERTNEETELYGWGTENYVELLKKVYRAAQKVEGGFIVDVTISSHWPISVNIIDPNDDAASQEIVSSITLVTEEALASGSIALTLPETRTYDNGLDSSANKTSDPAYFIFTSDFVDVSLAQVIAVVEATEDEATDETAVSEEGAAETEISGTTTYTLDLDNMISLSDYVSEVTLTQEETEGLSEYEYREIDGVIYAGSAAGIPDADYLAYYGIDEVTYDDICEWFGDEPAEDADFTASFNGKMTEDFLRERLADWQYEYTLDLSDLDVEITGSDSDEIEVGDWVLVTTYMRGTGQLLSGGAAVTMYNRCYVPDYYTVEGVNTIIYYWENYMLDDELRELIAWAGENGGSIFEDSLETTSNTTYWAYDLLEEMDEEYEEYGGYPYIDVVATVMAAAYSEATYADGESYAIEISSSSDAEGTADLLTAIEEDVTDVLNKLYAYEHCETANEFAASLGCTYRAQVYGMGDNPYAVMITAFNEGDPGSKGNGIRTLAGLMNITGQELLSMEAVVGWTQYSFNFADFMTEVYSNFSQGVNRVVLHGSPYNKTLNGYEATWPGWDQMGRTGFGFNNSYRLIWWDDASDIYNAMARAQAVLQDGTAKIDFAVLQMEEFSMVQSENIFEPLLDTGYSYNFISEEIMELDTMYVEDGILNAEGVGFKALVIDYDSLLSIDTIYSMIEYAEAGLPIVIYGESLTTVNGVEFDDDNDEIIAETLEEMLAYDNVIATDSIDEVIAFFNENGVASYASYDYDGIQATLYEDETDGSYYYYLYNSGGYTPYAMMWSQDSVEYKGLDYTDITVTLEGEGDVYFLDILTGDVTQASQYVSNGDGTTTVYVGDLAGGDAVFVVIAGDSDEFPEATTYITAVDTDATSYTLKRDGDQIVLMSEEAGDYTLTLSTGETVTVTLGEASEVIDMTEWNLVIDSYGPADEDVAVDEETGIMESDPSETEIITVDFGTVSLGWWSDLEVTDEQLATLGVDTMGVVSGIGYYTATFEWSDADIGAYLSFAYEYMSVTRVAVNGTDIDVVNNISDTVDIGAYLIEGTNTIEIEAASTLQNRANMENLANYGFSSITLTPYAMATVE